MVLYNQKLFNLEFNAKVKVKIFDGFYLLSNKAKKYQAPLFRKEEQLASSDGWKYTLKP